ncbi:MAG: glycosyltransferase [Actinobacteria bacterium]|nr:glycosyltransferase [Actinomycetota bacterium]
MRVLFVAPNLGIGGAERQWSILVPRLAERGLDVRVLTLDGEGVFADELRTAGVPVTCAWMRSRADLAGLRRALAVRSFGPAVIVTQGVSGQTVGQMLRMLTDGVHVTVMHMLPHALQTRHQLVLSRLTARWIDAIVAVTPVQTAPLVALGYRRNRILVIPNGLSPLVPARSRDDVRLELGLGQDDFVATLVAALRPEKRAHHFVGAVHEAHGRDGRVRGVVVGGGPELDDVRALAAAGGGVVGVLGARTDVPDLMGASDAICLSSTTEAFPMTLLEGMSLGKPLVSTEVGGANELVIPGETGVLVQRDDRSELARAILTLASDRALAERLGQGALERQRRLFTAERMVESYERAFRAVARAHSARTGIPAALAALAAESGRGRPATTATRSVA